MYAGTFGGLFTVDGLCLWWLVLGGVPVEQWWVGLVCIGLLGVLVECAWFEVSVVFSVVCLCLGAFGCGFG